jgi:hypothetical protein
MTFRPEAKQVETKIITLQIIKIVSSLSKLSFPRTKQHSLLFSTS